MKVILVKGGKLLGTVNFMIMMTLMIFARGWCPTLVRLGDGVAVLEFLL
jgi:hypothetical protein